MNLQVTFYNIFSEREVHVTLEEDVIAFACDGVEVLVEFCRPEGADHFIDILIWSYLNFDDTLEWMCETVLVKLEQACAEPRGIQGVQLAHAVIRPACLEHCSVMDDRQAVSMQELRETLMTYMHKRGCPKNSLENVRYTWQGINSSDSVTYLLGEVETNKVMESVRASLIEAAELLGSNADEICSSPAENQAVFRPTGAGKEREMIYKGIQNLREDIQNLRKDIQNLHNSVQTKLQELFTFAEEGERGRLPRFPIITKDYRLVRRVVTTMMPSLHSARLELLCEHHSEPHLVDGQPGLSFATLDDGFLKHALPYINAFLKVAHVAVKVGAHIAVGFGDDIPNFARVLALIEDTPELNKFPTCFDPAADVPTTSRSIASRFIYHIFSYC